MKKTIINSTCRYVCMRGMFVKGMMYQRWQVFFFNIQKLRNFIYILLQRSNNEIGLQSLGNTFFMKTCVEQCTSSKICMIQHELNTLVLWSFQTLVCDFFSFDFYNGKSSRVYEIFYFVDAFCKALKKILFKKKKKKMRKFYINAICFVQAIIFAID